MSFKLPIALSASLADGNPGDGAADVDPSALAATDAAQSIVSDDDSALGSNETDLDYGWTKTTDTSAHDGDRYASSLSQADSDFGDGGVDLAPPAWSGVAALQGAVRLLDDGSQLGWVATPALGVWGFAPTALTDGAFNFTAPISSSPESTSAGSA